MLKALGSISNIAKNIIGSDKKKYIFGESKTIQEMLPKLSKNLWKKTRRNKQYSLLI
jgi:hypothetical protein